MKRRKEKRETLRGRRKGCGHQESFLMLFPATWVRNNYYFLSSIHMLKIVSPIPPFHGLSPIKVGQGSHCTYCTIKQSPAEWNIYWNGHLSCLEFWSWYFFVLVLPKTLPWPMRKLHVRGQWFYSWQMCRRCITVCRESFSSLELIPRT